MDAFTLETHSAVPFFSCTPMRGDWPVLHAFSTRLGGVSAAPYATLNMGFGSGDDRARVTQNRQRFGRAVGFDPERLVTLRQVHGHRVVFLSPGDDPASVRGTPADALISSCPEIPLAVITADCFPVVLVVPSVPLVGIAHSGRRGTAERVVPTAILQMCGRFSLRPDAVFAAIGPGIGGCCYEVDEANAVPFLAPFSAADSVVRPSRPGHRYLDLQRAILLQLLAIGVPSQHIWSADLCTACHLQWFYSYRRDGACSGRMLNVVMIQSR
jgi:YfiH family protein